MRTGTEKAVRALLRANPDGLTLKQISGTLDKNVETLRAVLRGMPDSYIDRWELRSQRAYASVWCVVVPPEDCPRP